MYCRKNKEILVPKGIFSKTRYVCVVTYQILSLDRRRWLWGG